MARCGSGGCVFCFFFICVSPYLRFPNVCLETKRMTLAPFIRQGTYLYKCSAPKNQRYLQYICVCEVHHWKDPGNTKPIWVHIPSGWTNPYSEGGSNGSTYSFAYPLIPWSLAPPCTYNFWEGYRQQRVSGWLTKGCMKGHPKNSQDSSSPAVVQWDHSQVQK